MSLQALCPLVYGCLILLRCRNCLYALGLSPYHIHGLRDFSPIPWVCFPNLALFAGRLFAPSCQIVFSSSEYFGKEEDSILIAPTRTKSRHQKYRGRLVSQAKSGYCGHRKTREPGRKKRMSTTEPVQLSCSPCIFPRDLQ